MASANDWVQIVFLTLETTALIIFIHFVVKYTSKFKDSKDPYTIACFVFIIFTIVTKVLLRGLYMLPRDQCSDSDMHCRKIENIFNCGNQIGYYLPTGFFTIAVLINVTRWLILINSYKKMQYHLDTQKDSSYFTNDIQQQKSDFRVKIYNIALFTMSIFAFIVTLIKIIYQCGANDNLQKQIENVIFLVMLFFLNITSIVIYIYSQRYFSQYYQKQIMMNQDIISEDQIRGLKKSVRFLTYFIYTICSIIIIRLIVMLVYELAFSYDQFDNFGTEAQLTLSILIYLTEITLTLMMSQSIKQTTSTQKRTHTVQLDSAPMLLQEDKPDSDCDASQGAIWQEIEQNILKMEAFQVLEDVSPNKQSSQKIMSDASIKASIAYVAKQNEQMENNINSFGVDVSDANSSHNQITQ